MRLRSRKEDRAQEASRHYYFRLLSRLDSTHNKPKQTSGKRFPAGTLPSGTATNDPTLPVRGVAPIGDWTCRGQNAFPFPPAIAPAYSSTPFAFNTQYFILNDGRALTIEGYTVPSGERLS